MTLIGPLATSIDQAFLGSACLRIGLSGTFTPDQFARDPFLEPQGMGDALDDFESTLRTIRHALAGAWPDHRARVVMNPLSGVNGGLVNLFPEATLFVGLDAHPFLGRIPPVGEPIRSYAIAGRDFSLAETIHWYQQDRGIFAGQLLIGALSVSVKGFRLRSVEVLETQEKLPWKVRWRYLKKWRRPIYETQRDWGRFVHGLITFDSGEGTPVRQYLHVNTDIFLWSGPTSSWWFSGWRLPRPDVVVIKGGQDLFSPGARNECVALKESIIDWLRDSRGILIEGRDRTKKERWEFSGAVCGGDPSSVTVEEKPPQRIQFSYGREVRITRFGSSISRTPS